MLVSANVDIYVKDLYDACDRAVSARDVMREAVDRGTVNEYHRALREVPEVKFVTPLMAARRHLRSLSLLRRRALNDAATASNSVTAIRAQLESNDITKAMSAAAHGTLLWVNEQLGLPAPDVAAMLPPLPEQPVQPETLDASASEQQPAMPLGEE